jgi:hypothetical protein
MQGCKCVTGFVGPHCEVAAAPPVTFANGALTLQYAVDNLQAPTMVHFRMDQTIANWMSLMIIDGGTYKTGDSMTVYQTDAGKWVVEDQTTHPFNAMMADEVVKPGMGKQNLLFPVVWMPTTGTVKISASWSRKLMTGDTAADVNIPLSMSPFL